MVLVVNVMQELYAIPDGDALMCFKPKPPLRNLCIPKRRRYDIRDFGYERYFHGWTDVQGQGANNDYCRMVGDDPDIWLSCALAGTHGKSETNYNSAMINFDRGLTNTWYMKDEDGDGKADYCRCTSNNQRGHEVVCTKAGERGFFGSKEEGGESLTFKLPETSNCNMREVRPEFGHEYKVPEYR